MHDKFSDKVTEDACTPGTGIIIIMEEKGRVGLKLGLCPWLNKAPLLAQGPGLKASNGSKQERSLSQCPRANSHGEITANSHQTASVSSSFPVSLISHNFVSFIPNRPRCPAAIRLRFLRREISFQMPSFLLLCHLLTAQKNYVLSGLS